MNLVHELEGLQLTLRHRRQWEAAASLDTPVGLLRKQIEIENLEYERTTKRAQEKVKEGFVEHE